MDAETFVFGSFQLIPDRRLLLDQGRPVSLGSRAYDILTMLVGAAGETFSNSQIMDRVWPGVHVDEGALRVHIAGLRKTLSDGRAGNRFIVNAPGRGYAFVAPVTRKRDGVPPAAPQTARAPGNLPTPLANIVGRDDTITSLASQLARHRLVTIVGPGGIGKTTVAVAVARTVAATHPDGTWFVGLASVTGADLVPAAVAAALDFTATGSDPLPGLAAWLRDKQALIVLDNCEHVIDAVAVVAETILKAAPSVSILATSREPLRAEGESLTHLTPLATPPAQAEITVAEALEHAAVQLFAERALASDVQFSLTDPDASAICEICRRLDGLPLALELAAAQVEAFGLQDLAQGLNRRFALLTRGRRTALQRQQTLRATMDWSYDLLPEIEQCVLRRLAVFRCSFTMDAAGAVVGDAQIPAADVVDVIMSLTMKSLVVSDINSDAPYFYMLETTRAYALDRLDETADGDALKKRHAEYYRDLLLAADAQQEQRSRAERLEQYRRHMDDVRAGLDWAFSSQGDPRIGVALTIGAVPLWNQLSLLGESRDRVTRALATLNDDTDQTARQRMQLSAALGWALMYGVGRAREAGAAWRTTLELAERLNDMRHQQHALWGLCIDQFNNGNVGTALDFAGRFADLVAGSADPAELMMGDRILATAHHYRGDQTRARHHIDRALAHEVAVTGLARTVSAGFDLIVSAHYFQARILWLQGFAAQAMRVVAHNIEEGRAAGQALSYCSVLGQGACPIAFLVGDLNAAARYGSMLIAHTERYPVRLWNIWGRCFLGLVETARSDITAGLRTLETGLEQAGEARFLPRFLLLQGEVAQLLGRTGAPEAALQGLDQMLERCEARAEDWYVPELLRIRGELLLARDGPVAAGDAEELFRRSLDTAQRQGALSWELRAATSMARHWKDRGLLPEASGLLRGIYGRFTEGFDTTDLQTAKSLLDQLA